MKDLRNIDPTIASTVSQLEGIVRKKRRLEEDVKLTPNEKQLKLKNLTMDGCPVEDLGLDFTLPGYPNIELKKGKEDYLLTLTKQVCLRFAFDCLQVARMRRSLWRILDSM